MAVSAGNRDAATLLRDANADITAVGRCKKPALFHAIETRNIEMLEWLIEQGFDVNIRDEFGRTPLTEACEQDNVDAIDALIAHGADVNASSAVEPPIGYVHSPAAAQRLLAAGADPAILSRESKRQLCGLNGEPDLSLLTVSDEEFRRGAARRFGRGNPEEIDEPFWTAMVRSGVNGYLAAQTFEGVRFDNPVWCADRFGQSLTYLPDGRVVQVAGEHEDSYDPDFCIYNDVFVHDRGAITIYGYPEHLFPPTDFHTATLIGREIYLVGSLGYAGTRAIGSTQVFRLHTDDFRMERLHPKGTGPGWIYRHRANLQGSQEIVVSGGIVVVIRDDGKEDHVENQSRFVLDVATLTWRRQD